MSLDTTTEPKLRPPTRAELLADNKKFVLLAKKILHAVGNTSDGACCLCGVEQGKQHKRGSVCFQLVLWWAHTQYKAK